MLHRKALQVSDLLGLQDFQDGTFREAEDEVKQGRNGLELSGIRLDDFVQVPRDVPTEEPVDKGGSTRCWMSRFLVPKRLKLVFSV